MVELIIENETNEEICSAQVDEIKRVCEAVMACEDCNFDAEISLTFTDNSGIREINNEYRGIDSATDVLSFPMLEFGRDEENAEFETDGELVMLGDIVISIERAREQAAQLGHSMRRELAFLTAHSMLHLLGWDHVDDPTGEMYMIDKQNEVLGSLGLTREIEEF
ncbi:MAG: rRNA maturation RNase YbeY [Clostridia bacterium]|nr:rRNA maturation RNase YbeY [Clostridia bacterium]